MACIDMISWEVQERYLRMLFGHLRDEPPENFSGTTLQQVLKADRQVFMFIIKNNIGVRRDAMNVLPMVTEILRALSSYEVGFNLVPLPRTSSSSKDGNFGPERSQQRSQ